MRPAHPLAARALVIPLLVLAAACSPADTAETITPPVAGGATPVAFTVDNPDALAGDLFATVVLPFEAPGDDVANALRSGTLDAAGRVQGVLRPIVEIPRLNDALGVFYVGDFFFPPEGCPLTTTDPDDAALAIVLDVGVWDGQSRDGAGYPAFDALVFTGTSTTATDGSVTTTTDTQYFLMMSRAAWSAAGGPCPLPFGDTTIAFDLDVAVGWQVLRGVDVETVDAATFEVSVAARVDTITLEEFAAIASVGEVVRGPMPLAGGRGAAGSEALRVVAPWLAR